VDQKLDRHVGSRDIEGSLGLAPAAGDIIVLRAQGEAPLPTSRAGRTKLATSWGREGALTVRA
jgi:hypothetical protein